jgi:hypothetical protein
MSMVDIGTYAMIWPNRCGGWHMRMNIPAKKDRVSRQHTQQ